MAKELVISTKCPVLNMWFMDKAGKTAATPDLEVLVYLFSTPFEKIHPTGITCPQYNPTKKVCQIYEEQEKKDCSCLYKEWQPL